MLVEIALYFSAGWIWRERIYFKVWLSLFIADFEQRKISLFAKIPAVAWKLHSTSSERQFEEKCFFSGKEVRFIFFGPWTEKLGHTAERLPRTLIKLYLTSPEKQAKQIFPCNLRFLNHFRRLSQRRSAVQQILSDRSNKTAFYVSRETFWWTAIFERKKTKLIYDDEC